MNVLAGSISTRRVTTRQRECLRALVLAAVLMFASVRAIAGNDRDVDIRIHVEGDVVSVDASMLVAATPQEVWSVFVDFDHMAQFISNLKSSAVVARSGDTVTVAQAGEASYGPLKFAFESVRELHTRKRQEALAFASTLSVRRSHAVVHRPYGWEDAFA